MVPTQHQQPRSEARLYILDQLTESRLWVFKGPGLGVVGNATKVPRKMLSGIKWNGVVTNEFNNFPSASEGPQEYITVPVKLTYDTLHLDYLVVAEHILQEII